MSEAPLPHVVIVGGGFGGLYAARALKKAPVRITVVDRRNHHTFQPLLYQVATAALAAPDIAAPIRRILRRQKNVTVLLADAERVDVARRRVVLGDISLDYDYLILATGCTHAYFGHDDWARFAPGLKTIEDALEIRRRVLLAFEAAERDEDPERRAEALTFVVIGAGPTGVELAGALAEIARHTLARDFRRFDPKTARVLLLEAGPRILTAYPDVLSDKAEAQLRGLGVEVRTGAKVTDIDERGVMLGQERIATRTVLWAAGISGAPIARSLGVPLDRAGRVLVEPSLAIPGHPEVYVIGDLAALEQDGKLVPGVAQGAIQGGRHAATSIRRALEGQPPIAFRYQDKGSLATIGRSRAIGEIFGWRVSGFVAWLLWLFIHILFLVGFRNRFVVLMEWAAAYMTYQRSARLILTGPPDPTSAPRSGGQGPPASDGTPPAQTPPR